MDGWSKGCGGKEKTQGGFRRCVTLYLAIIILTNSS